MLLPYLAGYPLGFLKFIDTGALMIIAFAVCGCKITQCFSSTILMLYEFSCNDFDRSSVCLEALSDSAIIRPIAAIQNEENHRFYTSAHLYCSRTPCSG